MKRNSPFKSADDRQTIVGAKKEGKKLLKDQMSQSNLSNLLVPKGVDNNFPLVCNSQVPNIDEKTYQWEPKT